MVYTANLAPRIELHSSLIEALGEEKSKDLQVRFLAYKAGRRPEDFGRDVPFDWPVQVAQSELWHIHLLSDEQIKLYKQRGIRQQIKQTSDQFLVYVQHFSERYRYLLIALIPEPAHKICRKQQTKLPGYADIAEEFHSS
ncbi:type II toxin-antitoxin system YafO family toxin [Marinospirillum insulare]|uniref:type II toxin-antitoxin system YafO family toxin n=1 Tax=Marinospirillum insulare TaxID=217169 RepID=UPI00068D472A|nr:type II toxin-antitoxin system YafO family toxin [Marinospirillum insulare]